MTILTHLSGADERGAVMGVSESLRALSSLVGVLIGGIVWDATVHRSGFFDFHTAFRLCGLFALAAMLAFRFSSAYGESEKSLAAAKKA
jgi:predicted MFS family arabinose efflux permease